MYPGPVLLALLALSITVVPLQSDASVVQLFRKLARGDGDHPLQQPLQISPSPSPAPSINLSSGGDDGIKQSEQMVTETCKNNSCTDWNNMTACVIHPTTGQGSFLLVSNDGEGSLQVNVTIRPSNYTYQEMKIPQHEAKRLKISADVGGSSSIELSDKDGVFCVIHMGVPATKGGSFYLRVPSLDTYITPVNGMYLLSVAALITLGVWAYCKYGKTERHPDGVLYQELEMGQPESFASVNVEAAEGWDQGWDDNWDEENAVKTPGGNHAASKPTNGFTSRSSKNDGWGKDWDD